MEDAQLIGPMFGWTGVVMRAIAAFLVWRTRDFLSRAVDTTGRVMGYETSHGEDGVSYKPVIQFQLDEQQVVQFTDRMASNPPAYEVGEVIPIKYDPQNPRRARPAKAFRLWFTPGLLSLLGIIFLTVGIGVALA